MTAPGTVREFFVGDGLYEAAGQDDGSSEANAVRKAEASFAEIRPALCTMIEDEVKALVAHLRGYPGATITSDQIDAFAQSSDRIIDVAEPLGYPQLSHEARRLRETCKSALAGKAIAPTIFTGFATALSVAVRHDD